MRADKVDSGSHEQSSYLAAMEKVQHSVSSGRDGIHEDVISARQTRHKRLAETSSEAYTAIHLALSAVHFVLQLARPKPTNQSVVRPPSL
jgi:hypothetical protein